MQGIRHQVLAALALVVSLAAAAAFCQPASAEPSPAIDPRALELLKQMNAKLVAAQAFTFRARSTRTGAGMTDPLLAVLGDAKVAVRRPSHVRARASGATPPFDFYFDGATMTLYQPTLNVYATTETSRVVDALIPFALQNAGMLLPFADVLDGDAYATLIRSLTRARYGGTSTIAGNRCHHAAFAGPGAQWEMWIDARTSLPCRVSGSLRDMQGSPRFAVDFSDWKLDPQLPAERFVFAKPAGATEVDFRALMGR
jgi:hypothetical protein